MEALVVTSNALANQSPDWAWVKASQTNTCVANTYHDNHISISTSAYYMGKLEVFTFPSGPLTNFLVPSILRVREHHLKMVSKSLVKVTLTSLISGL